ncbi:MAG: bacterial Ig-like protein, partial [Paenibacillus sp.]|nr:bacterial Ig-like protein [Paenibacillus sp.]
GTLLGYASTPVIDERTGRLEGTVADFTKELSESNEIVVRMNMQGIEPERLAGKMIYVENDGERNAVYSIKSAEPLNAEGTASAEGVRQTVRLNIGDTTLTRRYADSGDTSKGYRYDIAEGSAFSIPLSYERF